MWEQYTQRCLDDKHLRAWPLRFTDKELDAWNKELHRRVDILNGEQEPSAENEHYEWECGYCPFAASRGGDCTQEKLGRVPSFFTADREDVK